MDIAFTVHLPVDTGSVPFIRGLCRQALEHLDVERTVVDEISLALTEACANVVQHAGEHVLYEVAVSIDDRLCRISVVDDGKGFDQATVGDGHLGLAGMRSRVKKVGGALAIRTAPGTGTTIEVTVAPALGDSQAPAA